MHTGCPGCPVGVLMEKFEATTKKAYKNSDMNQEELGTACYFHLSQRVTPLTCCVRVAAYLFNADQSFRATGCLAAAAEGNKQCDECCAARRALAKRKSLAGDVEVGSEANKKSMTKLTVEVEQLRAFWKAHVKDDDHDMETEEPAPEAMQHMVKTLESVFNKYPDFDKELAFMQFEMLLQAANIGTRPI